MNQSTLADGRSLYSDIIEVQSAREEVYGNGHFIWRQREVIDGEAQEKLIEYWARDNRYFRIDTQSLSNGEASGEIRRIIVRPEGFVKINARKVDDPGAIYDIGHPDEGVAKVKGQYFVSMANRIGTVQVQTYIRQWINKQPGLRNLKFNRDDAGHVIGSFSRRIDDGTKQYNVVMTAEDYRVQSWEMQFQAEDGQTTGTNQASITYGENQDEFPTKTVDTVVSNTDYSSEFECRLLEHQLEPAPLEVFSMGELGMPRSNPWFRRLVLLGSGIFLLFLYFGSKWLKRRRAEK
ncbi:hypothetical protein [Allorhodopirellula solitaria]|nr:hypothetical protein [Allorhodopirellula solitaria]